MTQYQTAESAAEATARFWLDHLVSPIFDMPGNRPETYTKYRELAKKYQPSKKMQQRFVTLLTEEIEKELERSGYCYLFFDFVACGCPTTNMKCTPLHRVLRKLRIADAPLSWKTESNTTREQVKTKVGYYNRNKPELVIWEVE
jgi:hypothetical protein